jgi:hypothetical protein
VPITTKVESSNPAHADTTLCDNVCQWLATGRWFLPGTLVSSINKTDHHDIIVILLKVALNTITLTLTLDFKQLFYMFFQNRKIKYLFMLCCKKIMNALLVYILLLGISNRYTIIYNVVLFRSLAGMTSHVPHLNTLPTVKGSSQNVTVFFKWS